MGFIGYYIGSATRPTIALDVWSSVSTVDRPRGPAECSKCPRTGPAGGGSEPRVVDLVREAEAGLNVIVGDRLGPLDRFRVGRQWRRGGQGRVSPRRTAQ